MKVKVLQEFTDKNTQTRHKVDEVFECSNSRLAEIRSVSKKLVAVVEEEPAIESDENTGEPEKKAPVKGTKNKEVKE